MKRILFLAVFLIGFLGFTQGQQLNDTLSYNRLNINKVKQTVDVYMLTTVYQEGLYSIFNFYERESDRLLYSFKATYYYEHKDKSTSFQCVGDKEKLFILHFSPGAGRAGVVIKYPLTDQKIVYYNENTMKYIPKQKI